MKKVKFILMMGGPGSGKGTQSQLLVANNKRILHVSTGDLIRQIIHDGSHPRSKQFSDYVKMGVLIPDEEILAVLKDHLEQIDPRITTVILDGYPRTAAQVETFISHFGQPHAVLYLEVSAAEMKKRLLNRGQDRSDDIASIIDKRIEDFMTETIPAIGLLLAQAPVTTIQGNGTQNEIAQKINIIVSSITEHVEPVSPWTLVKTFWQAGQVDIYALSATVRDTYGVDNFSVGFSVGPKVYFLQSRASVQAVLRTPSHFNVVYHHFAQAAGLEYEFTALDSENGQLKLADGRPNFWYLAHHGFKAASQGDQVRIAALVKKHLPLFLQDKHMTLHLAFERFFDGFWCEYLFGAKVNVTDFSHSKQEIQALMRYAFYENRFKSIDPFYLTSLLYRSFQTQQVETVKWSLRKLIANSTGGWVQRFKAYLEQSNAEKQLGLSEEVIARIVEDNIFDLFFEPDFLSGIIYESLVEVVNKGLNLGLKEARESAYQAGLYRAYLFPYRGRVVQEAVLLADGTIIPAGSTVFMNLLQAGIYHSAGPRSCPGQAFARYFKDSFFGCLSDIEFRLKSVSTDPERAALAGNPDLPISAESYQISWRLRRDSLQPRMSHHLFNGTPFYDVLEVNEDVVTRDKIVRILVHKVRKMMQYEGLQPCDMVIVAPEVRGLSIAGMVADRMGISLVTIRKAGNNKMSPEAVVTASYAKGYGQMDTLELPKSKSTQINNMHVVILDDGLASGGSALACADLVAKFGGKVELILTIINHQYAEKKPGLGEFIVKTLFDFKSDLALIFNLTDESVSARVKDQCIRLLAQMNGGNKQRAEAEFQAFIQFRRNYPLSRVIPLSEEQRQQNVKALLSYLSNDHEHFHIALVTSEKALKIDASKFIAHLGLALNAKSVSLADIDKILDVRKKEIKGQAEQPVGLSCAQVCAKTRVSESVTPAHSHGITIESFMHDFNEAKLARGEPVLDAAVIGLGARQAAATGALTEADIVSLLSPSIELPAHFMSEAIKTAEAQGKPKVETGYAVTAGSRFEHEIQGSNGAAWQFLVTMTYDSVTGEVYGLSRRGQMIDTLLNTLAFMDADEIAGLKCNKDDIATLIAASLNELKISPREINCHAGKPISLGLFGELCQDRETGLFSGQAASPANRLTAML